MRRGLAYLSVLLCAAAFAEARPKGEPIRLFNGKDLSGWTHVLEDPNAKMEDVWSVDAKEGVLVCKGKPMGYLRTVADYKNYVLKLQWRFIPPVSEEGGSGVLLRVVGPDKVWPKMIEAQVQPGQTGDFWVVDGAKLRTPKSKQGDLDGPYDQRIRFASNEKPLGEWNQYEITCDGGHVTLKVNGEVLNEGFDAEAVAGKIALESEGAEIHFRDITLQPLP